MYWGSDILETKIPLNVHESAFESHLKRLYNDWEPSENHKVHFHSTIDGT